MRFDTQNAGHFLITKLQRSSIVDHILEDGSDIILLKLVSGQQVLIYLIDSPIGLAEIRATLSQNTQNGFYTLYIFWNDLLLPAENDFYEVDDWMMFLLNLYSDKLYGFDVQGRNTFFFPVYFQGEGKRRYINLGDDIDYERLGCVDVILGQTIWNVAGFAASEQSKQKRRVYYHPSLAKYFDVLELPPDAGLTKLKSSYRRLARRFHPDVNSHEDATERMKAINEAYDRLIKFFQQE